MGGIFYYRKKKDSEMNILSGSIWKRLRTALIAASILTAMPVFAEEFLEAAQAFKVSASQNKGAIDIHWNIAPGYYMYADRISVSVPGAGTEVGPLEKPKGIEKFDSNFGKIMLLYKQSASLRLPIKHSAGSDITLQIESQGCAESGLCYPPQEHTLKVALASQIVNTPSVANSNTTSNTANNNVGDTSTEEQTMSAALASGSLWRVAVLFFGLGLLLSFTPCVLPMIPILSSIIVGSSVGLGAESTQKTRGRGFALSLAYCAGMVLVYTSLGIAAGLLGEGLAAALQKPWVIAVFATALFCFGLSMFDVFTFQMPSNIQTKLSTISNQIPGGKFTGVFVMGGLSALIVGPCVAAPLAGALVYISKTGNVLTGGVALFFLSVGMSQPLLLTGLSAGKLLPKAGAWMESIKRIFGLLLFATALWLANPILPAAVFMLAVALLLLMCATWLQAFSPLASSPSLARTTGKALGLMLAGIAALQLIGVGSGGTDVTQPIKHLVSNGANRAAGTQQAALNFKSISTQAELTQLLQTSAKPVVLDVYADWCTSCKEMEHSTFTDERVVKMFSGATLVRIDVTKNNADDKALMKRYGLFGPPALLVLKPDGSEFDASRVIGFKAADPLMAQLSPIIKTSK
jgi:thioredoxin:protein disulfide reductase